MKLRLLLETWLELLGHLHIRTERNILTVNGFWWTPSLISVCMREEASDGNLRISRIHVFPTSISKWRNRGGQKKGTKERPVKTRIRANVSVFVWCLLSACVSTLRYERPSTGPSFFPSSR